MIRNSEPKKKEIKRRLAFSTSSYFPFLLSNVENIFRSMDVVNVCAHLDLQLILLNVDYESANQWNDAPPKIQDLETLKQLGPS